jgi:hypothetical protein
LSNAGNFNLFAGVEAGQNNTAAHNSFFGFNTGRTNTTGSENSFFGSLAGAFNTSGIRNSFFGSAAGLHNTGGELNSFFGSSAGSLNTSGGNNSFFGSYAGKKNTTGSNNTFVGGEAGSSITESESNTFIGAGAAYHQWGVAIGNGNTLIGAGTDFTSGVHNATAIGAFAFVSQSNSVALGSTFTSVGIGTGAPQAQLHISTFITTPGGSQATNGGNILLGDAGCGFGSGGIGFLLSMSGCTNYALRGGGDTNTYINRPTGGTIIFREGNGSNQVEIRPGGTVGLGVLDGGGSVHLCRNGIAAISTCSSSLRYKTDVKTFGGGLQLISRLQPVSFNWKSTHQPDIGLIAEEVATVEPLLAFKNQNGEIEGVNYSQLTAVLINAVKEQQKQIDQLKRQLRQLRNQSRNQNKSVRRPR